MSAALRLRKLADGRIQARRLDGLPLTAEDKAEARRMAASEAAPVANRPAHLTAQEIIDIDAGKINAVLIDSDLGPLWFAFDDAFISGDDHPVFFASELPHLRQMDVDELRRRYEEKWALRGGWIRDRIDEPTKH